MDPQKLQAGDGLTKVDAPQRRLPSWSLWCGSCTSHLLHERRRKPLFLCYGRRHHLDVVSLPDGVVRGLLMVVELLVVRSRCEMACRWSGVASTVSTTVGLGGMVQQSLGGACV